LSLLVAFLGSGGVVFLLGVLPLTVNPIRYLSGTRKEESKTDGAVMIGDVRCDTMDAATAQTLLRDSTGDLKSKKRMQSNTSESIAMGAAALFHELRADNAAAKAEAKSQSKTGSEFKEAEPESKDVPLTGLERLLARVPDSDEADFDDLCRVGMLKDGEFIKNPAQAYTRHRWAGRAAEPQNP